MEHKDSTVMVDFDLVLGCAPCSSSYRVLATLHLIFTSMALYHYLVANFGNGLAVLVAYWCVTLLALHIWNAF
jgi:hypothetical protein